MSSMGAPSEPKQSVMFGPRQSPQGIFATCGAQSILSCSCRQSKLASQCSDPRGRASPRVGECLGVPLGGSFKLGQAICVPVAVAAYEGYWLADRLGEMRFSVPTLLLEPTKVN